MKLAALIAWLMTAPGATADARPMTADAVVAGIQAFYDQAKDLKSGFEQTYTYKVYKRSQKSAGTVFFKKPGRMRWDYSAPARKLFIADGQHLWVYEPDEGQVFKRALRSAQLPVALTFMSGQGKLADAFDAALVDHADAATWVVELTPKKDEGDYKSIRLKVRRDTYEVTESTVIDPVGNTNHLVFRDVQTNLGLPDKGFAFTVPDGVRIITEPGR
jgi:outer membrane lipoprotein carrier protein